MAVIENDSSSSVLTLYGPENITVPTQPIPAIDTILSQSTVSYPPEHEEDAYTDASENSTVITQSIPENNIILSQSTVRYPPEQEEESYRDASELVYDPMIPDSENDGRITESQTKYSFDA